MGHGEACMKSGIIDSAIGVLRAVCQIAAITV